MTEFAENPRRQTPLEEALELLAIYDADPLDARLTTRGQIMIAEVQARASVSIAESLAAIDGTLGAMLDRQADRDWLANQQGGTRR